MAPVLKAALKRLSHTQLTNHLQRDLGIDSPPVTKTKLVNEILRLSTGSLSRLRLTWNAIGSKLTKADFVDTITANGLRGARTFPIYPKHTAWQLVTVDVLSDLLSLASTGDKKDVIQQAVHHDWAVTTNAKPVQAAASAPALNPVSQVGRPAASGTQLEPTAAALLPPCGQPVQALTHPTAPAQHISAAVAAEGQNDNYSDSHVRAAASMAANPQKPVQAAAAVPLVPTPVASSTPTAPTAPAQPSQAAVAAKGHNNNNNNSAAPVQAATAAFAKVRISRSTRRRFKTPTPTAGSKPARASKPSKRKRIIKSAVKAALKRQGLGLSLFELRASISESTGIDCTSGKCMASCDSAALKYLKRKRRKERMRAGSRAPKPLFAACKA